MQRRNFVKTIPALAGSWYIHKSSAEKEKNANDKPCLTIAHITDVHIRDGDNAPERFRACLRDIIKKHQPDFFLNGGDAIHDASYKDVIREKVVSQWDLWDTCIKELSNYEVHSCIGNHDIWWNAPSKEDDMYGTAYVAKRLKMPSVYYHFSKKNWHFFILDGNNGNISLGEVQMEWLANGLKALPANTPVVIMSHYPILTVTNTWEGGQHADHKELKALFYQHQDKIKFCLSGHQHLLDHAWYNGIDYYCNGAMSGFWWGKGNKKSAKPFYYQETPPGYAILKLYSNGDHENKYYPTI